MVAVMPSVRRQIAVTIGVESTLAVLFDVSFFHFRILSDLCRTVDTKKADAPKNTGCSLVKA